MLTILLLRRRSCTGTPDRFHRDDFFPLVRSRWSFTSEEHDFITAGVSHLPHIIASALVNLVNMLDSDQEYMKTIAAGGFRDITRIASSSPIMWEQICVENNQNISNVLDDYIRLLVQIKWFCR